MLLDIFFYLSSLTGVLMSLSWFFQLKRLFRTKSSEDLSILQLSVFLFGNITWLIYGFIVHNFPIIISFFIGSIGVISVLLMAIKLRNKN